MPHIKQDFRPLYERGLTLLSNALEGVPLPQLTYVLYVLARRWMFSSVNGTLPKYEHRSNTLAALRDAHNELRRLYMDRAEDRAIDENGEAA